MTIPCENAPNRPVSMSVCAPVGPPHQEISMSDRAPSSRIPGFYDRSPEERGRIVADLAQLSPEHLAALSGAGGLAIAQADHMIENVVGLHHLPIGVAVNFVVNGRDVLVPMALE